MGLNYKKICEEFEGWIKGVINTYENCPELEKYVLRSEEYKKVLTNFKSIKKSCVLK